MPELLQHEVTGQRIADEVARWLDQPEQRKDLESRFELLHEQLRIDAAATAAHKVLNHIKDPDEAG